MSDPRCTRRRRLVHLSLCLPWAALAGCVPTKTVTLRSDPSGATLTVYKIAPEGQTRVSLDDEESKTPATVKLEFPPDVKYRVEAHRVLCSPAQPVQVTLDPQETTDYVLKLPRFKQFVDGLVFAGVKQGDLWHMVAGPVQTTATIDTSEPDPQFVDQPVAVTDSQQQQGSSGGAAVDFPSFNVTAGPAGTLMVYEQTTVDKNVPGGLDAKLFKLPLTGGGGQNPTRLTTNRAQQHNPTFSYTGEDILFDTADNARTRSPVQFKVETNEASLNYLQHDADTCETDFSAGRDALAFTAYAPNAAGPDVMASALDGSGMTKRAAGMSPQLSPDQNRIAFVHRSESNGGGGGGGGHLRLATVNVRGPVTVQELSLDADHDVADPHWSPDGKLIAYATDLRDGHPVDEAREPDVRFREGDHTHSFLWVVRSDGQQPIQLTHGENFDSHPVFDPDGRTIYFRSNRGGTWNLWKCRLTDTAMARLGAGR